MALHVILVCIRHTVSVALVCRYGNILSRLAGVPYPVAGILFSLSKLWHKFHGLSTWQTFVLVGNVCVFQTSELVVSDNLAVVFHHRRNECRNTVGRRKLAVARIHKNRISEVVISAACVTLSSAVNPHLLVYLFREWHLHALNALVMSYNSTPIRTYLLTECRFCHKPRARVGIVEPTGAVMIVCPRQVLHALYLCRDIFHTGGQAVVHIREEVVALVPCHVCQVYGKSASHCGMSDVSSAFVHLSEFTVCTCLEVRLDSSYYQVSPEVGQSVAKYRVGGTWVSKCSHLIVFQERKSLIVYEDIIA